MNGTSSDASPLEAAAGAVDAGTVGAFKQLANETRLAILLALWERYEPFADDDVVAFSELRKHVDMRDKGRFNYHLSKLEGHFVRKTDEGYALRGAGFELVRTVIAGTGVAERTLEPTRVDRDCYLCGGSTVVTYRDQLLYWACTECDGLKSHAEQPSGTLGMSELEPAALAGRSPEALLNAAWTRGTMRSALGGVCDACSGPMDAWLRYCDDHADGREGVCPTCGWRERVVARFRCAVCKRHHQIAPWWLATEHPAVVAFYYDRGVPLQFEDGVAFQPRIESNLQADLDQELLSTDPLRVRVTVTRDGDEVALTLDEELTVVDVTE